MDPSFIMPVIALSLAAIGGLGGYFTLRSTNTENTRRIDGLEARAKQAEDAFAKHQVYLSDNYVRSGAMEKLEERLGKMIEGAVKPIVERFKELDHQVRGIDQKLDNRIVSMLRVKGGKDAE